MEVTLAVLPKVRWRRTWKPRAEKLIDGAAARAGVGATDIAERARDDDRFADTFFAALDRAVQVGDEDYLELLGRLLGAACDNVRVDEVNYIINQFVKLDPVQVRVLLALLDFRGADGRLCPLKQAKAVEVPQLQAILDIPRIVELSNATTEAILQGLEGGGFVTSSSVARPRETEAEPSLAGAGVEDNRPVSRHGYKATLWTTTALRTAFPSLKLIEPRKPWDHSPV